MAFPVFRSGACAPWLAVAGLLLGGAAPAQSPSMAGGPPVQVLAVPGAAALLTPSEAVRRAWAANPELAAARREWEASAGALLQAGLRPNPEASWLQEDLRHGSRSTTLQLSQPLERGGKRAARVALAEQGRAQAEVGIVQARAELRAAVLAAYAEVQLSQQRLRLAQEALALAASGTEAAARRVQAGKVSPVEQTRAGVAQAAAQADIARAEGSLRAARQRLSALWGDPGGAVGSLADGPALPAEGPPEAELARRMAEAPQLLRARLELRRAGAAAQVERTRGVADVSVTVGAKRVSDSGSTQAVLGLSVPLPLFDRNQGRIAEALSREDKARDELAAAELRLASDVAQARETLRAARAEALTLQREAVPGARSAWQAAAEGFRLGKFSYLEALDAQRTLVATQAQYLRALGDTCRAAVELERLLGITDEDTGLLQATQP